MQSGMAGRMPDGNAASPRDDGHSGAYHAEAGQRQARAAARCRLRRKAMFACASAWDAISAWHRTILSPRLRQKPAFRASRFRKFTAMANTAWWKCRANIKTSSSRSCPAKKSAVTSRMSVCMTTRIRSPLQETLQSTENRQKTETIAVNPALMCATAENRPAAIVLR